jgi:hypothetical protein
MTREYGRYILKEDGTLRDSHVDIIALGIELGVLGINEAVDEEILNQFEDAVIVFPPEQRDTALDRLHLWAAAYRVLEKHERVIGLRS